MRTYDAKMKLKLNKVILKDYVDIQEGNTTDY